MLLIVFTENFKVCFLFLKKSLIDKRNNDIGKNKVFFIISQSKMSGKSQATSNQVVCMNPDLFP